MLRAGLSFEEINEAIEGIGSANDASLARFSILNGALELAEPPLSGEEKRLVIAALNRHCSGLGVPRVDSNITYQQLDY